jgi:hypothetical protein
MTDKKVVRLADLEVSAGEVLLPSGREVKVAPIDGRGMQIQQAMLLGTAQPGDMWRLAALLLPDATPEEIERLTANAIGLVVQMACGALEQVLQLAEAAGKVKAPSPAAPPSDPAFG